MGEDGKAYGVVSAIKTAASPYRHVVLSGRIVNAEAPQRFELGSTVEITYSGGSARISETGKKLKYETLLSQITESAGTGGRLEENDLHGDVAMREMVKALLPGLREASALFLRKLFSGAPIVVRFHGDGDGTSGALCLYKAIAKLQEQLSFDAEVKWQLNRGISYSDEALYYDRLHFNSYESTEKPLVCIIDFGSSDESNSAIGKAQGLLDFIWLDHHSVPEAFDLKRAGHYINPLMCKGTSDFAAGYLTGVFSMLLANIRVKELMEASLISDFSAYADSSNSTASRMATVLDFVTGVKNSTHYLDGPLTPGYLSKIIHDTEKLKAVYNDATGIIKDAIEMGMSRAKQYKAANGTMVNVVDFSHIAEKYGGYLLPGRYSSRLHGALGEKNPNGSVTIVNFRNAISIRVGKQLSGKVNLLKIIEDLKSSHEIIESGGGHKEAASIMAAEGHSENAIKLLLHELGA